MTINDLTFDELMDGVKWRYVVTGDTYPHREKLASWGFHWEPGRAAWVEDNGLEPDHLYIRAARGTPGLVVIQEALKGD